MFKKPLNFWQYGLYRETLGAFCAHSALLLVGVVQAYSAILLPQLKKSEEYKNLTVDELSWVVSLGTISNPIGSFLSGVLAEYCGRKRAIQLTALPVIVGSFLFCFAKDVNWIYAGRLITGIAAGMSPASYTYVGEISTPKTRGFLQTFGPILASLAILLIYIFGYYLSWKTVAYISIGFAIFEALAMELVPESPSYLLKQNRKEEGYNILLWFRMDSSLAQKDMDRFYKNEEEAKSKNNSFKEKYFGPQTVKPFLIIVGLFTLQEFSGLYTLLFYVSNFFEVADPNFDEMLASIIVGAIRFFMSIIAGYLMNVCGRKILCASSSGGMAITMGAVAIYLKYYEIFPKKEKVFPYLPLIGMILNVAFSTAGLFPVPWVMIGELFPVNVRSIVSGVVVSIAQLLIFVCVKIYGNMNDSIYLSGTLFVFTATSALSVIYCLTILTETKNKTLEEIEAHFRGTAKCDNMHLDGKDNVVFDPEEFGNNITFSVHL